MVGTGASRVLILGNFRDNPDWSRGAHFDPYTRGGSVLYRAFRRLGMDAAQFWLHEYSSEWYAMESVQPKVILVLGEVATQDATGMAGDKQGVGSLAGFVLPSHYGIPVIPCFHPSFLRMGKMSRFGILLRALRLAVAVAREGREAVLPPLLSPPEGYIMYPDEAQALEFEREAREAKVIAYDIETPWSGDDAAEEAEGEQTIKSIQFSLGSETGIFFPWREHFNSIARRILSNRSIKLGWNNWRFDNPVLQSNGCSIGGESHDLMWAWHHLNPDLPRGLQFAAAQSGWPWPWKHYHASDQQFYGIVDVDVLHFLAGVL